MFFPHFSIVEKQRRQLYERAVNSQSNAYAKKSFINNMNFWVIYLRFSLYFSMVTFPASAEVLIGFSQFLAENVKSMATVKAGLSAVKKLHLLMGQSIAAFSDYVLQLTLMGLSRGSSHITKQARPITPEILLKIFNQLDLNNFDDAIFWAVCIMAFFLLFRKSNLIPDKKFGFDPRRQLKWSDLVYTGENIIVGIRWSKTDQFGRDLKTYPLPVIESSNLCPLKALNAVLKFYSPDQNSHVFALPEGGSYTYRSFQRKLRVVLEAAGVHGAGDYSSHSFRRGGATFAYLCGVPSEVIKLLGNWRSDCYLKYLHLPLEIMMAASELIKIKLMYKRFYS